MQREHCQRGCKHRLALRWRSVTATGGARGAGRAVAGARPAPLVTLSRGRARGAAPGGGGGARFRAVACAPAGWCRAVGRHRQSWGWAAAALAKPAGRKGSGLPSLLLLLGVVSQLAPGRNRACRENIHKTRRGVGKKSGRNNPRLCGGGGARSTACSRDKGWPAGCGWPREAGSQQGWRRRRGRGCRDHACRRAASWGAPGPREVQEKDAAWWRAVLSIQNLGAGPGASATSRAARLLVAVTPSPGGREPGGGGGGGSPATGFAGVAPCRPEGQTPT
jgi:hypothetical protein